MRKQPFPDISTSLRLRNNIFTVYIGNEEFPIRASIYPNGNVDLKNLDVSPCLRTGYLPLGILRISKISAGLLLPFVHLHNTKKFQLWRLDRNLNFVAQISVSETELKFLLRIACIRPDPAQWTSDASAEVAALLRGVYANLKPIPAVTDTQPFTDSYKTSGINRQQEFLKFAIGDLITLSFADLLEDLVAFAQTLGFPEDTSYDEAEASWNEYCDKALWNEAPQNLPHQFRYEFLREILAIFLEKDVSFNPLAGRHEVAKASRFCKFTSDGRGFEKFCILSCGGLFIVEFRAASFSASTFAYQIGEYFIWKPTCFGGSTWFRDLDNAMVDHSEVLNAALASSPATSDRALLINSSDQCNLGHTLWNDFSGLYVANSVDSLSARTDQATYKSFKPGFGGMENYSDFAERAGLLPAKTRTFSTLEQQDVIFEHPRPVILKSLIFSESLRDAIHRFTNQAKLPRKGNLYKLNDPEFQKVTILVNVRTHNKTWRNIHECFSYLVTEQSLAQSLKKLCIVLEYSDGAEDIVQKLDTHLNENGIEVIHAYNLAIGDLTTLISRSDMAVAPVGSGLVLPTWVWHKPVITHGDPRHMNQLEWWECVLDKQHRLKSKILAVANEDILPMRDAFYSDYEVRPQAFSTLMIGLLTQLL
ncbi:MAG: hypothetical protein AAF212_11950 [Verrucomicrobiota bacterium]